MYLSKKSKLALVGGVTGAVAAAPAFALDSGVSTALTTAFASMVTDATALQALVIVPIIGILTLTVIVKLIKRFGNKV